MENKGTLDELTDFVTKSENDGYSGGWYEISLEAKDIRHLIDERYMENPESPMYAQQRLKLPNGNSVRILRVEDDHILFLYTKDRCSTY